MAFNDLLLRTLNKEKTERPPVWLMRQAGRYMEEYRAVRRQVSFLELCKTPELAAKVTHQPIDILGADAAILFSDILIPVEPMGVKLDFNPAPVISNPVRTQEDADKLIIPDPEATVPYVYQTIDILVKELNVPLIGFSGAPFTLACYMVEGGGSKNWLEIKKMMHNNTKAYTTLMEKLTESTLKYLQKQIDHGCPAVQMFDTWAGVVSPYEYTEFIFPYVKYISENIRGGHFIYFAKDGMPYADTIKTLNCTGLGVDWKTSLKAADKALDHKFVLQGNLDPALLYADIPTIEKYASIIIEEGRSLPGHIFNLGHGIMPDTPVEHVKHLVKFVTGYRG